MVTDTGDSSTESVTTTSRAVVPPTHLDSSPLPKNLTLTNQPKAWTESTGTREPQVNPEFTTPDNCKLDPHATSEPP